MRTDRTVLESHGYNPDTTPLDTLMAGPDAMHREVAEAMAHDDDEDA